MSQCLWERKLQTGFFKKFFSYKPNLCFPCSPENREREIMENGEKKIHISKNQNISLNALNFNKEFSPCSVWNYNNLCISFWISIFQIPHSYKLTQSFEHTVREKIILSPRREKQGEQLPTSCWFEHGWLLYNSWWLDLFNQGFRVGIAGLSGLWKDKTGPLTLWAMVQQHSSDHKFAKFQSQSRFWINTVN